MPAAIGELKQCPKCKETKHISEYYKRTSTTDGLYNYCKQCASPKQVRQTKKNLLNNGQKRCSVCKEIKSINDFYNLSASPDRLDYSCKKCRNAPTESRKKIVAKYMGKPEIRRRLKQWKREYRKSDTYREYVKTYNQNEKAKKIEKERRKTIAVIARSEVNKAVGRKEIPHISTQKCVVCGNQAENYHHHLGYDPEHWLDVIPVCVICHGDLHSKYLSHQENE